MIKVSNFAFILSFREIEKMSLLWLAANRWNSMTHLTPKNNDLLFIFCGIPTVAFQSTYYMNRYNMSTSLKCAMSALNAACHSNRILLPTPDAFFFLNLCCLVIRHIVWRSIWRILPFYLVQFRKVQQFWLSSGFSSHITSGLLAGISSDILPGVVLAFLLAVEALPCPVSAKPSR